MDSYSQKHNVSVFHFSENEETPKRLSFYIYSQIFLLLSAVLYGVSHQNLYILVLFPFLLNLRWLYFRNLWSYRLEYFRILIVFFLFDYLVQGDNDLLFMSSSLSLVSLLWLKIIKTVF